MDGAITGIKGKKTVKLNKQGKITLIISLTLAVVLLISGIVTLALDNISSNTYYLSAGGTRTFGAQTKGSVVEIKYTATTTRYEDFSYSGITIVSVDNGNTSYTTSSTYLGSSIRFYCRYGQNYTIRVKQIYTNAWISNS